MLSIEDFSTAAPCFAGLGGTSLLGDKARGRIALMAVLVCCLIGVLVFGACAAEPVEPKEDDIIDARGEVLIETAEELEAFFLSGPESALIVSDIDMGDTMLKLTASRGKVSLTGEGRTIRSDASCAIRLEDGASIELEHLLIESSRTAIGMLGSGNISGSEITLNAQIHAIHAANSLIIGDNSEMSCNSETGIGIRALGVELGINSDITISAATYALRIGRGGIALGGEAKLSCTAYGDNCVYSEGELSLNKNSAMRVRNSGEHNAALVGGLIADPSATIEATGGTNGMGLFIMELNEDITLKGFSKPEARLEAGSGSIEFS